MPYIDPMLNAACNRQPPDPADILKRLREYDEGKGPHSLKWRLMQEAADEIERLRAVVEALHRELGN